MRTSAMNLADTAANGRGNIAATAWRPNRPFDGARRRTPVIAAGESGRPFADGSSASFAPPISANRRGRVSVVPAHDR